MKNDFSTYRPSRIGYWVHAVLFLNIGQTMKIRIFLYLIIFAQGLMLNWLLVESNRVQDILLLNLPQIAQKSYVAGCIGDEPKKAFQCKIRSIQFENEMRQLLGL